MKKISLLSLIFILSFNNYSFGMAANSKQFVFQKNLPMIALQYAIGLLGIKSSDSQNSLEIKANALARGAYSGYLGFNNALEIKRIISTRSTTEDKATDAVMGILNVPLLLGNIKFCYQSSRVFRKADKIAKFNKVIKLSLFNEKIRQFIWLTFNVALPYGCFAATKMYYDKTELKNAFYDDQSLRSSVALIASSYLANFSENRRLSVLHKTIKKETLNRIRKQSS